MTRVLKYDRMIISLEGGPLKQIFNKRSLIVKRKLRRVADYGWLGGVCAGIGYWLKLPVWLVRLVFCIFFFTKFPVIIVYFLLWIFMPEWEKTLKDYHKVKSNR